MSAAKASPINGVAGANEPLKVVPFLLVGCRVDYRAISYITLFL